ncbi:MAG: metal-dependent hydrolase [Actinobacteria bacterium]|nr:metal-dependent hydrolase [Actinomycetota bacterium]
MAQTSDPTRQVPTRRISFEEALADLPRHFAADGNVISSHVIANLSAVFPDGEDFFVRSVRHYRSKITDPDLKKQVNGFIGQEAMHGREHRVFNDRLAELGYPTKRVERFTRWGLELRSRKAPASANLAATAALEHFTATLAELVMRNEDLREAMGADVVRGIFEWHALEESEHKAVAFDVYQAAVGKERLRVWTMKSIRFGFIIGMTLQVLASLARDPAARSIRRLRKDWKAFKKLPVLRKDVWDTLRDYDRPDFHPDDHDTVALVEEWQGRLFGEDGTLTDKLVGAAA